MDVAPRRGGAVARIAAAIGDPARARMLYSLMDHHARTSTELATIAGVSPSTASAHLNRLQRERLIDVLVQGKHRYYSLPGSDVAGVLESLSVLAGRPHDAFVPNTPQHLRAARTCYDHMAGTLGVLVHDRFEALDWLSPDSAGRDRSYDLTPKGIRGFESLGVDVRGSRTLRRRFAFACLDWSERRSHLGGALGSAFLDLALDKRWVAQDPDSRALRVTRVGKCELLAKLGISCAALA